MPWSQGKSLVWGFTCSDTLATSHVPNTPVEAVETLGSYAPLALKFLKDVGSRIELSTGEKRSTSFLFQSIGIATQRGNAISIAGTVPSSAKRLDEIYYL